MEQSWAPALQTGLPATWVTAGACPFSLLAVYLFIEMYLEAINSRHLGCKNFVFQSDCHLNDWDVPFIF